MVKTFEFADHVVGIMVNSNVDEQLLQEIHGVIEEKIRNYKKINLFVEIEQGRDVPMDLILKDLIFKLKKASHFQRIAVVTEKGKFEKAMNIKDLLMDAEVETFRHHNRIKAMNWIAE